MKKFTVISLAALVVLAFGATAYAQVKLDFRASGSIDAQTHYSHNVPPLNANATAIYNSIPADYNTFDPANNRNHYRGLNRTVSYWDSRMSLRFEAAMGKELNGVLQFEIDSTRWGNSQGGIRPGSEAHAVGVWSTDRAAIEVKYMYFDVGLPYFGIPVPMNVRVGAQPLAIRPWFFMATDGMGISGGININPVNINPLYFKAGEGYDWAADDVEFYGVQANAKLGTFTVGGYFLYQEAQQYPLANQPFSAYAAASNYAAGTMRADFWWIGLYADGKAGPLNLQLDAAFDRGEVRNRITTGIPNVQYQGWGALAKVEYPFEKFNFGLTGMYASGSDANQTGPNGLPGSAANNGRLARRVESWVVPIGSENGAANGQSAVFYGMEAGASGGQGFGASHNYNQSSKGAFGGTWFAKIHGSYKITPWYKITLQGLYIGDTTKHGNTYGTARRTGAGTSALRDDSFIGVEADMINEFEIYKNLTFKLFGGYMWAGNAMDLYNINAGANSTMNSPWAIRTRLMYTF